MKPYFQMRAGQKESSVEGGVFEMTKNRADGNTHYLPKFITRYLRSFYFT
ncbi:MAG TPA: hypothetical protein PLL36_08845 [Candidatus Hydrogenedentes bacterium]|jgi:hypothetical protein|nr:hypothetical protein [Candidatus Hydrogenedentota bacterium]HQN01169.1 hypothetical protein [Candidatus Hydrogenedentota bacterium]